MYNICGEISTERKKNKLMPKNKITNGNLYATEIIIVGLFAGTGAFTCAFSETSERFKSVPCIKIIHKSNKMTFYYIQSKL
jgi:hypothetical protein